MASPNNEPGALVRWMRENGMAITRESYLKLARGNSFPDPWTAQDEADLPPELQDWTRFQPDEQPGD
jgi:hypothetical protein